MGTEKYRRLCEWGQVCLMDRSELTMGISIQIS